jgi:hypothetical protein
VKVTIFFSVSPQRKLVLWYTRRTPGARSQSYEDNIKKIVDFSTVCLSDGLAFAGDSSFQCS